MGGFRFGKERLKGILNGGSGLIPVSPTTMQMTDPSTRLSRVLTVSRHGPWCHPLGIAKVGEGGISMATV